MALSKLGYNVIYDFVENGVHLYDEWRKIFNDGWDENTFKSMYEDVDVTIDVPACYFWEEISKAFPDAKIILTIRDDEEAWCNSFENQLKVSDKTLRFLQLLSPTQIRVMYGCGHGSGRAIFGDETFFDAKWFGRNTNKEMLKLKYRAHNAYVLQNAPKDKLLVFRVSEGWGPLCKFLGLPIPNEDFPHKNVKGGFLKELFEKHPLAIKMQREMMISLGVIGSLSLFLAILSYRRGITGFLSWASKLLQDATNCVARK